MRNPKLRRELFLATIFSLVYLSLSIFNFHLERIFQGINIFWIRMICLAIIIILFVRQIFKIMHRRKKSKGRIKLRFIFYLPAIILFISIVYTLIPVKLDSENFESKVVLTGCYENGLSHARIRLRADNNFEIKWTNESNNVDWYFGSYKSSRDTIFLTYFDRFPDKFGSIVLNRGQTLSCLDKPQTLDNFFVQFYIGNCKEDND
jgi:hypothetical protein